MLLGRCAVDREANLRSISSRATASCCITTGLTEVFDSRREMLDVDGLQKIVRENAAK